MTRLLRTEWLRLSKRRDLRVVLLVLPVLVAAQAISGHADAAGSLQRLPVDVPGSAREPYNVALAAYAFPRSIATLLSSGILVLATVYAATVAFASDYATRTIKTWLMISGDRLAYVATRALSTVVLVVVMVVELVATATVLSGILADAGMQPNSLEAPTLARLGSVVIGSLVATVSLAMLVALAAVATRSPTLTLMVAIGYGILEPLAVSLAEPNGTFSLVDLLPVRAALLLRASTAVPLLGTDSQAVGSDSLPSLAWFAICLAWALLAAALTAFLISKRDVLE